MRVSAAAIRWAHEIRPPCNSFPGPACMWPTSQRWLDPLRMSFLLFLFFFVMFAFLFIFFCFFCFLHLVFFLYFCLLFVFFVWSVG